MRVRYHIGRNGKPARCYATRRPCPFGGAEAHFGSLEAAQAHIDKVNEEKYGLLPSENPDKRRNAGKLKVKSENLKYVPRKTVDEEGPGECVNYDTFETFLYEEGVAPPEEEHDIVLHMRMNENGTELMKNESVHVVKGEGSWNGRAFETALAKIANGDFQYRDDTLGIEELQTYEMEDGRVEFRVVQRQETMFGERLPTHVEYRFNMYALPPGNTHLVEDNPDEVFTEENLVKYENPWD